MYLASDVAQIKMAVIISYFGKLTSTTISKICREIRKRIEADIYLATEVETIKELLNKSTNAKFLKHQELISNRFKL